MSNQKLSKTTGKKKKIYVNIHVDQFCYYYVSQIIGGVHSRFSALADIRAEKIIGLPFLVLPHLLGFYYIGLTNNISI